MRAVINSQFLKRIARLFTGLFLYAVGVVLTIHANIGYAPWDVFHAGLAKTMGISIGVSSIIVGVILVAIAALFKEKIGLGTVLSMVLIGVFVDIIMAVNIIPLAEGFIFCIIMLTAGLYVIALASYFYMGSGFGAGPRDSIMVLLMRKTSWTVGVCRAAVEISAVVIGFLLGGMVGIGTIISAFGIGFCIQSTFSLLKFDAADVDPM